MTSSREAEYFYRQDWTKSYLIVGSDVTDSSFQSVISITA